MKSLKQKTVTVCDICEKEQNYAAACMTCKKDFCYDCRQKYAVDYPHSIYCSGSGDGFYCLECDGLHRRKQDNPKHSAYLVIQDLRRENEAYSKEFRARAKAAEEALEKL